MEEIEATRVALDSRLVNVYKLRCWSFSGLAKIAQFRKEYHILHIACFDDKTKVSNLDQLLSGSWATIT